MIYKKDYNELAKNIHNLMQNHNATQDKYGAYWIDTLCGKMRIHLDDFTPKRDYIWIFTKLEHPENAKDSYCDDYGLNKYNGKCNMFSGNIDYIYKWLNDYIADLTSYNRASDVVGMRKVEIKVGNVIGFNNELVTITEVMKNVGFYYKNKDGELKFCNTMFETINFEPVFE